VTNVFVIRKGDLLVDSVAVSKLSTWRYHPLVVDGRHVPFCFNLQTDMTPEIGTSYS
jgi:hypothetical protein